MPKEDVRRIGPLGTNRAIVTWLPASLLSGGLFGAVTVGLNQASWLPLTGLAAVLGGGAGWGGASWAWAWLQARRGHRFGMVAVASIGFLATASVAYYVVEAVSMSWRAVNFPGSVLIDGGPGQPLWVSALADQSSLVGLWLVVSVVAGTVLAVVVRLAVRRDWIGLLAKLTLPVGFAFWSAFLLHNELFIQPRPAVVVAHLVACVAGAIGLVLMVAQHVCRIRADGRSTQ